MKEDTKRQVDLHYPHNRDAVLPAQLRAVIGEEADNLATLEVFSTSNYLYLSLKAYIAYRGVDLSEDIAKAQNAEPNRRDKPGITGVPLPSREVEGKLSTILFDMSDSDRIHSDEYDPYTSSDCEANSVQQDSLKESEGISDPSKSSTSDTSPGKTGVPKDPMEGKDMPEKNDVEENIANNVSDEEKSSCNNDKDNESKEVSRHEAGRDDARKSEGRNSVPVHRSKAKKKVKTKGNSFRHEKEEQVSTGDGKHKQKKNENLLNSVNNIGSEGQASSCNDTRNESEEDSGEEKRKHGSEASGNEAEDERDGDENESEDPDFSVSNDSYLDPLDREAQARLPALSMGFGFAKVALDAHTIYVHHYALGPPFCARFGDDASLFQGMVLAGPDIDALMELCLVAKQWRMNRLREVPSPSTYTIYRYALTSNSWEEHGTEQARPPSSVILRKGQLDAIVRDATDFISSATRDWYESHGLPYRRSYLFYGSPGVGKTSTICCLAGMFGLNLCFLSIAGNCASDDILHDAMKRLPSRSLMVIEVCVSSSSDAASHSNT